jgi:GTP-binding protein
MEHLFIETDEEYVGAITQSLANRKGQLKEMNSNGNGSSHIEFEAPVRGLIGFQTEFLTNTRGTGIINRLSAGFVPWLGEIRTRGSGSLISDRPGPSTTHALVNLQERGKLFIGPGVATYEGMIVGENARADDMDVNPCREKKLTNMRSSAADTAEHLTPNLELSLEQALEFIAADECLEVTPGLIRLRKVTLDTLSRNRETKRSRKVSV